MTSMRAMTIVKHKLRLDKVGFLGTLDPLASGVLVLLCGTATKLADTLHEDTKTYRTITKFGIETTTLDPEGEVVKTSKIIPTREQITAVLWEFVGDVEITVPKFSAVHIGGKRAYDLARKKIDFTPPTKTVNIKRFELLDQIGENEFSFEIECETGTYIRSLAQKLANRLNTVAIAREIIRTCVGKYKIENAKTIDMVSVADIKAV